MTIDKPIKVYVDVFAVFNVAGEVTPRSLICEDVRKYKIDKVLDCKPAAVMRAGGHGDRFTIQVNRRESYLFFERSTTITGNVLGKWYVERRVS